LKPTVKKAFDRVLSYPFFQSVGQPVPASVTKVNSWKHAAKICRSKAWEECGRVSTNLLARTVAEKDWYRGNEQNGIADELRPLILAFVDSLLGRFPLDDKGMANVRAVLSWDIMFVCLESEYSDLVEPRFYVPVVEPWYASGHFPCGWDGDEFPDNWDGVVRGGKLMVF
jgi:hypothetical protein